MTTNNTVQNIVGRYAPDRINFDVPADTLSAEFQRWMLDTAAALLVVVPKERLTKLEVELAAATDSGADASLSIRAAAKLAVARAVALNAGQSRLSIIAPMYGENTRLKPRGRAESQHKHGEDALRHKVMQLDWLTKGTNIGYVLYMVDDMSKPEDGVTSGQAAQAIVDAEGYGDRVKVLFLDEGVRAKATAPKLVQKALRGVEIPKNTKKAAAIYYGMAYAIAEHGADDHFVGYIDTDLTVNAGLFGVLHEALQGSEAMIAAGSRRLATSVLKLGAGRNLRANLARYLRHFLLGDLLPKDTQCGIKLAKASAIAEVLGSEKPMQHLDFTFDVELLSRIAVRFGKEAIVPVAIAAFDSAAMTTTDSSVHWQLHRTALELARQYDRLNNVPNDVEALAEQLAEDEVSWQRLLEILPNHPDLVAGIEGFDSEIADAVGKLIN